MSKIKYSKNEVTYYVGADHEYSTFRWSTMSTLGQGKKLLSAVAPSMSTMADMWMASQKEQTLDEIVEGTDIDFLLTGAVSQLTSNFTDEYFEELCDCLLSNHKVRVRGEDGEMGSFEDITDWSDHFDKEAFAEDFDQVIMKSAKANLYDFFMKQRIVRSNIEKVLTVLKPLLSKIENVENVDLS